ncbi:MAG: SpvB/TcaC N-terminal domain-containing protein, partial [Colwellia sp.]
MNKINRPFIGSYLVFVAAFLSMPLVHATDYNEESFVFFAKSDANSVFTELHMQKSKNIVLIHGDIVTPIDLSAGKSFQLTGTSSYSPQFGGYDSYQSWDGRTLSTSSHNVSDDINVLIGDFNGDGFKDQLLQSKKNAVNNSLADQTLIIVYGSNSTLPLKVETVIPTVTSGGISTGTFNASSANVSVGDYNGDGISDIQLTSTDSSENSSSIQTYAYGNSQNISEIKWELSGYQSITPTPNTDGVLTSIPNIPIPAVPVSNIVGLEVGGKGGVSPSGSGSYSIPIDVVPALSGFQPSLSLQYDSQALPSITPIKLSQINPASGSMGLGWSLSGLSAVSRCQTDLTRETVIDAVDYDSNDQFCLDGQRLILVNGSHGESSAEYRTEMGGNARIFSIGEAGSGPQSFKVVGSNGDISEYGYTEDSRQEALDRIEIDRWSVSKVKNSTGSEIDFNYEKDTANLIYRITSITYEGNTVSFNYDASTTVLKNSLSKIVTGTQSFEFKYISSVNDIALRLKEVKRCANLLCTNPTVFDWNTSAHESSSTVFSTPISAIQQFGYWESAGEWSVTKTPRMMADVDGDGLSDIVGFASSGVIVGLSDGDGTFTQKSTGLNQFGYWESAGEWRSEKTPRMMADINGDGLQDIIGFASGGVVVALSDGDGTFTMVNESFNAFGYWASAGQWTVEKTPRVMADVNGDGLSDIVGFASGGVVVALSDGDGTFTMVDESLIAFGYWASAGQWTVGKTPRVMADVNGDGLADIVGFASGGVVVALSDGDGTFTMVDESLKAFGYWASAGQWTVEKTPRMMADI